MTCHAVSVTYPGFVLSAVTVHCLPLSAYGFVVTRHLSRVTRHLSLLLSRSALTLTVIVLLPVSPPLVSAAFTVNRSLFTVHGPSVTCHAF